MILISKSSLSPKRPGGSRYQNIVPLDEKVYIYMYLYDTYIYIICIYIICIY